MCELMVVWSVSYSCCYPWLRGCPIIVFNVPIHPSCYVVLVEDQGVEVSERSGDNNAACVRGGEVGGAGGLAPASRLWPVHARSPS